MGWMRKHLIADERTQRDGCIETDSSSVSHGVVTAHADATVRLDYFAPELHVMLDYFQSLSRDVLRVSTQSSRTNPNLIPVQHVRLALFLAC